MRGQASRDRKPDNIAEEAISANAIAGKTGAESPSSRLMPRRPEQ